MANHATVAWDMLTKKFDKIPIKTLGEDQGHTWRFHIKLILHQRLYNNNVFGLREWYEKLTQENKCLTLKTYTFMPEKLNILGSCLRMAAPTQKRVKSAWWITVHRSFMINITVVEAYIPYTAFCATNGEIFNSNTSVLCIHEGHCSGHKKEHVHRDQVIEYFSGHILSETVYTKWNKATVFINIGTDVETSPFPVHIEYLYQIHSRGMAYRFTDNFVLPPQWSVSHSPCQLLFIHSCLHYKWYLSNLLTWYYKKCSTPCFIKKFYQLNVSSFTCLSLNSTLGVYRGLQSWHSTTWHGNPVWQVYCNLTKERVIIMNFHMYATITLGISAYEQTSANITMLFSYYLNYSRSNNITNMMLTDHSLHTIGGDSATLQYAHYNSGSKMR